jgi:hypothetical protein
MKKRFLLYLFFVSTYTFACSCAKFGTPFHLYSSSELVADVTFTKVYPDLENKNSPYINVDLKFNEIFKGKRIKNIKVYGAIFEGEKIYGSFTSCSLGAKVGQRMIVFMKKNEEGLFVLHYCDHKIYEENRFSGISFNESKNILRLIKTKDLPANNKYSFVNFGFDNDTNKDDFEKVKGLKAKNRFAIFEITLNTDGSFKEVNQIQKFESEKDDVIFEIVKNGKINVKSVSNISDGEKFTLIMFSYPKEKNNMSFISQYFL